MTTRRAWHFVYAYYMLRNYSPDILAEYRLRDGSPSILGATETHDGPMVLCKSGLHWSEHALDALQHARSPIVRRVRVWGDIQTQADKGISRNREVLWQGDVSDVLRAFARKQALSVIYLWDAPDGVKRYLETGDLSPRAKDAARSATKDAVRNATWSSARSAAMSADVAWGAASAVHEARGAAAAADAARGAVVAADAARAAVVAAAAARTMLDEMLLAHIGAVE